MSSKQKQQSSVWSEVLSMDTVFGPPPILPGEDASAYQALLRQLIADVRPADIIEKICVRDIVDLTWEILRWRRIKKTSVSLRVWNHHYEFFQEGFRLTPEGQAQSENSVRKATMIMATRWLYEDPKALNALKALETEKLISPMSQSINIAFIAELDKIERIDRLIAGVESRRNAVFREIDRRRDFARSLRDAIQKAEDAEFEVVKPKAQASKANGKAA